MRAFICLLLMSFSLQAKENILIFLADDLTWFDLDCYGNKDVQTPNIDRFSSEALKFNNCFTNTAMCAVTRQVLYTGMHPVRSGAYPNHSHVKESTRSIAHHFKKLGYKVALAGKTHIAPRECYPFEYLSGNEEEVKKFISKNQETPWLLIFASDNPHGPYTTGPKDLYDPEKIKIPPMTPDNADFRKNMAAYYSEITELDREFSFCMNAVKENGLYDKTAVIFTSEHGSTMHYGKWSCYDAGIKTSFLIRWPGVTKPRTETGALVEYADVLPTLIQGAGGEPDKFQTGVSNNEGNQRFDGRSFWPLLNGETDKHKEFVFGIHTNYGVKKGQPYAIRSVRTAKFKLIWNVSHNSEFGSNYAWQVKKLSEKEHTARTAATIKRPMFELYDISVDPFELNNIASQNDETVKNLKLELDKWMMSQGDKGIETEMNALSSQSESRRKKTLKLLEK